MSIDRMEDTEMHDDSNYLLNQQHQRTRSACPPPPLPPLGHGGYNSSSSNSSTYMSNGPKISNDVVASVSADEDIHQGMNVGHLYHQQQYQQQDHPPAGTIGNRSTATATATSASFDRSFEDWKFRMMMQQHENERRNLQYLMEQNLMYRNQQEIARRIAMTNMQLYRQHRMMIPPPPPPLPLPLVPMQSRFSNDQFKHEMLGNSKIEYSRNMVPETAIVKDDKSPSSGQLKELPSINRRGSQNIAVRSHLSTSSKKKNAFRRPLTAYNFFFSAERDLILKIIDQIPDSAFSVVQKHVETSSIANKTCPTEMETLSNESSSLVSSDENIVYLQDLLSKTELSPAELAEHEESIKVKAQQMLDIHMEADRVKKPHRKTHGKVGFRTLGKLIGIRWRTIDPERRKFFEELARQDAERYNAQIKAARVEKFRMKTYALKEKDRKSVV